MIHDKQSGPQMVALEAGSVARATTDSSPSATDATTTTRARCLPDLDVQGLAVLSAALDDAVDALDGKGLTR